MEDSGRIPTYITGLDERLGGGVPRGHIVLVSGPAGSLKSTLVYRILYHAALDRGLSGLYLPVIFMVWSLMGRGVSIELRNHVDGLLWREFWDTVLAVWQATPE